MGQRGPVAKTLTVPDFAALSERVIPPPPSDLGTAGARAWASVWEGIQVQSSDALVVSQLCRLEDEASELRELISAEGAMLTRKQSTSKGEIVGEECYAHPGIRELRRIGSEQLVILKELGLSPTARARLGLAVLHAVKEADSLDLLQRKRAERLGEPVPPVAWSGGVWPDA